MKWLDNLENGGEFSGTTNKGFNYNGAWGGPAAQNGKKVETETQKVKRVSQNIGKAYVTGKVLDQFGPAETLYDFYNIGDALNEGDPMKIIPNVFGAFIPGLSGKAIEAVTEEYLPKTPEKNKKAMRDVLSGKRASIEEMRKAQESIDWSKGWNNLFENGGSIPGSVGFSYARHGAPSNGKYAKKTLPSAQDGLITYNPDTNSEWKGDSERTIMMRIANAEKSGSKRAIEENQKKLEKFKAFNTSKQKYIEDQRTFINDYLSGESTVKELSNIVKDKYNFDLAQEEFAKLSPREMITKVMTDRANAVINSGKGYPLTVDLGEETNKLTCIHGVCKAATEAGVSFDALKGYTGVRNDEKNPNSKYTVDYNPSWVLDDNYKKVGFERVPEGELPQAGDWAQYEDYRDNSHADVSHMEFIKNVSPTGYESFNNYNQTNNPIPGSGNSIRTFEEGNTRKIKEFPETFYFRLKEEAADKIVKTDPQYKQVIDSYNKYKNSDEFKLLNEKKTYLETNKPKYDKAQQFLDNLTKNSKLKSGGIVKDNNGYWDPKNHGKIVEINSNNITMKGVNQPLIGVGKQSGTKKLMKPGKNYNFVLDEQVIEYPLAKDGSQITKLDQLTNWTNYNKPQKGGWLDSLK